MINEFEEIEQENVKLLSENRKKVWDEILDGWNQYLTINQSILELSNQNKNEEALNLLMGESKTLYDKLPEQLSESVNYSKEVTNKAKDDVNRIFAQSIKIFPLMVTLLLKSPAAIFRVTFISFRVELLIYLDNKMVITMVINKIKLLQMLVQTTK
nr:MCP four helix bundle domain-containing protein [Bacillus massiliigorillae]